MLISTFSSHNVNPLFAELDDLLLSFLSTLSEADWHKQTIAGKWRIKDVAAHLLDGNIRTISASMHKYSGDPPENIAGYADLVQYLNGLNASWVEAMKRVSPQFLLELLRLTGPIYTRYITALDPALPAQHSVAWAGEERSLNCFHVAREYTEKWIHQQQIRDAMGDSTLLAEKYFVPLIDTFFLALPHHFRTLHPEKSVTVKITIKAEYPLVRFLFFADGRWIVSGEPKSEPTTIIEIPQAASWKLFSKSIPPQEAQKSVTISGEKEYGVHLLSLVSVMA